MTFEFKTSESTGFHDVFRNGELYGEYEVDLGKNRCRVRRVVITSSGERRRFLPCKWQRLEMPTKSNVDKILAGLFAELPIHKDYQPE